MATKEKVIFGVCNWLGKKFNIDVSIVRIAFVIFGLFIGSGIMLYLVLWLVKILSEEN